MCGISGIVNFSSQPLRFRERLNSMARVICHRGPDDVGILETEKVGLGFVRLSIIDLSHGHQPISNEDDTVFIIFNGEIYNYRELRTLLLSQGHVFKTGADTEVILHLYEEYGAGCLQYLRGMFAFCIYDSKKEEVFCARDRFGIKPFYFYRDGQQFVFSSEIKGITALEGVDKSISFSALDAYLAYGYTVGTDTIYDKIKKLRPGCYLRLSIKNPSRWEMQKYWEVKFEPDETRSEDYWCQQIRQSFEEAVKVHMISDVPLGAFLSGGIDSGSIVGMMSRLSEQRVKTFSIGFPEKEYNELPGARIIAEHFGTEHHELVVEKQSIDLLSQIVDAFDEPFADSSAIPTYLVSQFASNYVKVALSGDGGDELFGGYKHYHTLLKAARFSPLTRYAGKVLAAGKGLMKHRHYRNKYLYYLSHDPRYMNALIGVFTLPERLSLYHSDHLDSMGGAYAEAYKYEQMKSSGQPDQLTRIQESDIQNYLVDDILTKTDIASMQNSIELRVPFLDHVFAEETFRIPSSFKVRPQVTKYIFKKAMSGLLPEQILKLPKKGFEIPLKHWFKNDLRAFTHDNLLASDSPLKDYLKPEALQHILDANGKQEKDYSTKIWSLIILDSWLRKNRV
jgi:asparagine synthase (glutamine-hydrolysing)